MYLRMLAAFSILAFGGTVPHQIPQPTCSYTISFSALVLPKDREFYALAVNDAVATWKASAPKAARFVYVIHGDADLTFKLGPEQIDSDDNVLGYCDDHYYPSARVGTLSVITEWGHWKQEKHPMSHDMVKAVTLHEMGHFLGLDHSFWGVMRQFDMSHLCTVPDDDEIKWVTAHE